MILVSNVFGCVLFVVYGLMVSISEWLWVCVVWYVLLIFVLILGVFYDMNI